MASLMNMARTRFKSKSKRKSNNNMAKRRKTKKGSRRKSKSSGSSSGVFSGKILGFKIPLLGDALRNKTVQKMIAGAGIVSIVLSAARLVNQPKVNEILSKKVVRVGLAAGAGDIVGGVTQAVIEEPNLINRVTGRNGQQPQQLTVGGGGVA